VRKVLFAVGGIVVPWFVTSAIVGARVLPPPHVVIGHFLHLLAGELPAHALASVLRVTAALIVATTLALPLGIAMGRSLRVNDAVAPAAYVVYPVPKIALLPVVLLVFGVGDGARIVLLVLVVFFQLLPAVRDGAREVDEHYLLAVDSLGGRAIDRLRYVIWPSVLPHLLTALRTAAATALAVLFFAETFFTNRGLGYFIVTAWMRLEYLDMYAGIVAISVVGLGFFALIDVVYRRTGARRRFVSALGRPRGTGAAEATSTNRTRS
jgi:ABC-type nitrate/sulfonate/bicarbonate transport system permease component